MSSSVKLGALDSAPPHPRDSGVQRNEPPGCKGTRDARVGGLAHLEVTSTAGDCMSAAGGWKTVTGHGVAASRPLPTRARHRLLGSGLPPGGAPCTSRTPWPRGSGVGEGLCFSALPRFPHSHLINLEPDVI